MDHPSRNRISFSIPRSTIKALLEHFGPDAVSRGWCVAYYPNQRAFYEVIDESKDATRTNQVRHVLTAAKMSAGLQVMVDQFPHHLDRVFDLDQQDAPAADLFVQCCLFGEEKYA